MIRRSDFREYYEWQAGEKMNSTGQASIVDKSIVFIPPSVETVLCVGVGDGYEAMKITETNRKVVSISLNAEALIYPVTHMVMDMHKLGFEDKSFDLIYAKDVFEHAFSHWLVMKEMARVSKKYVYIILPDVEAWSSGKYHTIVPNKTQLVALAKRFNLQLDLYNEFEGVSAYLLKK